MLKVFLFSCLVLYVLVGMSAKLFTLPQEEIFPIYSWSLFSTVPNTVYRYDVQIMEYEGKQLQTPLLYREANTFVPNPDAINVYIIIQAWAKAVERRNIVEAQKQQEIFEKLHLFPNTRYQLVKIKYNPIERWENNTVRITPFAEYMKY